MPLTPEQIAKIRQKEAVTPDALKRDALTDYHEGYFFVTLNTRDKVPILSCVVGNLAAKEGTADGPRCEYSALGRRVMEVWGTVPSFHPGVEILGAEAMPEHFHGLLHLKPGNKEHLGRIVGGFMMACSHEYWDLLGIDWRNMRKDPRKSERAAAREWQDRDHTRSKRGPALFVRGYNDVEAIDEEEVETKKQYLREQARRRLMKGAKRTCYTIHRAATSKSWTMEALRQGLRADRYLNRNPDQLEAALQRLLPRIPFKTITTNTQNTTAPQTSAQYQGQQQPQRSNFSTPSIPNQQMAIKKPTIDYLGNPSLMSPERRRLPLICHRADAGLFEKQKAAVMEAARNGAVIVSAFISPKEREIMKQLLVELLPVVQIMDNGFSDRYKPTGKAFYAVGEDRLVQISPWTYRYEKETTVNREMCMVMNQLVRAICNCSDDWWK